MPIRYRFLTVVFCIACVLSITVSNRTVPSSGHRFETRPDTTYPPVAFILCHTLSCYELVGVVTQPPKRRKRRGKVVPGPVGLVAEELNIPVLCPEKVSR